MKEKRIFFIRHTEVNLERGICYGYSDVELCSSYPEQFKKIQSFVQHHTENPLYFSSPLKRCLQLASYLSGGNLKTDERLKELNFGRWELKKWDELPPGDVSNWMNHFVHVACPEGEAFCDLYSRTNAFFQELISQEFSDAVVITHGGVIRALVAGILGIPLEKTFSLSIEYGKITKISVSENHTRIHCINQHA